MTAHELARYMGLYNNVELGHPDELDPIDDSDATENNLMFYSEDNARLRRAMSNLGLREVRTRFDFEGTKVVAQS